MISDEDHVSGHIFLKVRIGEHRLQQARYVAGKLGKTHVECVGPGKLGRTQRFI